MDSGSIDIGALDSVHTRVISKQHSSCGHLSAMHVVRYVGSSEWLNVSHIHPFPCLPGSSHSRAKAFAEEEANRSRGEMFV